jgi:hypothetical protein
MDAYDLIKWREKHFDLDRNGAARAMGIGRNSLRNYEEGKNPIPPYIPLVCAAIDAGLSGWTLPASMLKEKKKNPDIKPSARPPGSYERTRKVAEA